MYKPDYSSSKTAYIQATNLFDSKFYFMTSAYRVYKVLDNNIAGLSTPTAWGSTEGTPTTTTANPVIAGNYMIKYMYTLSTTDVQNFLTPDFIPAPAVAEGSSALVDGQLNVVTVTIFRRNDSCSIRCCLKFIMCQSEETVHRWFLYSHYWWFWWILWRTG